MTAEIVSLNGLPVPVDDGQGPAALSEGERDFLLLTIFVLAQHGYFERAGLLAEAMYALGDGSVDVLLARAVLRFQAGDWDAALACLDELDRADPAERFGRYTLSERQRMRRYLKARCLFELDDRARARDALDGYLRHGAAGSGEEG